jgi:hypothetical protein
MTAANAAQSMKLFSYAAPNSFEKIVAGIWEIPDVLFDR